MVGWLKVTNKKDTMRVLLALVSGILLTRLILNPIFDQSIKYLEAEKNLRAMLARNFPDNSDQEIELAIKDTLGNGGHAEMSNGIKLLLEKNFPEMSDQKIGSLVAQILGEQTPHTHSASGINYLPRQGHAYSPSNEWATADDGIVEFKAPRIEKSAQVPASYSATKGTHNKRLGTLAKTEMHSADGEGSEHTEHCACGSA
ncbi:MAG: hypothetical protein COA79_20315 [Planctomycetota bacterium]|nr:MAG: hypothetical protein COA79_20315 [Planctomycetota bacterium]